MTQLRDKTLLKKIAYTIKVIREKNAITQEVFYNDTNIHIGRIEQARMNVSISTLDAICKYFNITLVDFFKIMEKIHK